MELVLSWDACVGSYLINWVSIIVKNILALFFRSYLTVSGNDETIDIGEKLKF